MAIGPRGWSREVVAAVEEGRTRLYSFSLFPALAVISPAHTVIRYYSTGLSKQLHNGAAGSGRGKGKRRGPGTDGSGWIRRVCHQMGEIKGGRVAESYDCGRENVKQLGGKRIDPRTCVIRSERAELNFSSA